MAVDPVRITRYNRTTAQLEELLLFCILVAGKNATQTSVRLQNLLDHLGEAHDGSPFALVRASCQDLAKTLREFGIGCYNLKARGMEAAARAGLNLRTCSVEDLEKIPGIGMKTARFFVLHTRRNARLACLDTHILRWLAYYTGRRLSGHTPARRQYLEMESLFLQVADAMGVSPADLDLRIWNRERGSDGQESLAASA